MLTAHVSTVIPAFLSAAASVNRWLVVANDRAGRFQASEVSKIAEDHLLNATIYHTADDPQERRDKLRALISQARPSAQNRLGVLVLGGDGTLNDVLGVVMHHIFPEPRSLVMGSPIFIADRLMKCGIQLGLIGLGGANDTSSLYGTPRDRSALDPETLLHYCTHARLMALNMGLAEYAGGGSPVIFAHNLSAGLTIARIYEKTPDERGLKARRHRQLIGLGHNLWLRPVWVRLESEAGVTRTHRVAEVLVHATVRADGMNGFPGTPQPGLGIKLLPARWLGSRLTLFAEIAGRGRASLKGDPQGLLPGDRLKRLSPELQLSLAAGEAVTFSFLDNSGNRFVVPVQTNGDFANRTDTLRLRALPPYPLFMGMEGSLMQRLTDITTSSISSNHEV